MKKLLILLLLVLPLAACGESEAPTLTETLEKMLVLVDQKKDRELLKKYADMSKYGEGQVGIPAEKLPDLKAALLVVQKLKPVMSDDGKEAVFKDPKLQRPMKFVLLDGGWRLQN